MSGRERGNSSPLAGKGREGGRRHRAPSGTDLPQRQSSEPDPLVPPPPTPTLPRKGEGNANLVLLGEFGRAHGLKGEVRLKAFTENPKSISAFGPLQGEDGRRFVLKSVRPAGGGSADLVIARVEGVATREGAETLNRIRLYAPRESLQASGDDNEFLLAELIGLAVKDKDGRTLGALVAVPNYGGGDLLEIAPEGGGATALLPFTEAFVPEVDVAAGHVVVDAPQDLFSNESAPPLEPDGP